jgi:hypothetical protein
VDKCFKEIILKKFVVRLFELKTAEPMTFAKRKYSFPYDKHKKITMCTDKQFGTIENGQNKKVWAKRFGRI